MSRTYRKSSYTASRNRARYIDEEVVDWKNDPFKSVRRKRTEEEMIEAQAKADAYYEERCVEYAKRHWISVAKAKTAIRRNPWSNIEHLAVPRYPVAKHTRDIVPMSKEEAIKYAADYYDVWERDGKYSESGRNKFYKKLNKKTVRNNSRRMISKIMKGEDYDKPYPGDYMGKKHIWSVW